MKKNKKDSNTKALFLSAILVGIFQLLYNFIVSLMQKSSFSLLQVFLSLGEGIGFFVIIAGLFVFLNANLKKNGTILLMSFILALVQSGLQVLTTALNSSTWYMIFLPLFIIKFLSTFLAIKISNLLIKK